jgi:hypothetical protein
MGMKFQCQTCGGSGQAYRITDENDYYEPCPECKEGWQMLGVQEECTRCGKTGRLWNGAVSYSCGCNQNRMRYRPLTDEEVEEVIKENVESPYGLHMLKRKRLQAIEMIIDALKDGTPITHKGSPVKLMPWEAV